MNMSKGTTPIGLKKILLLVEGQSEETFIQQFLSKELRRPDLHLQPVVLTTKRTQSGRTFKGGLPKFDKVRRQVLHLLGDSSAAMVTTMLDYYGLPADFPGMNSMPEGGPLERVKYLETQFEKEIGGSRFLAHLTLHEFETLLLVDLNAFVSVFPADRKAIAKLEDMVHGRPPEAINDGRDTHPSALIQKVLPKYQKLLHGSMILEQIKLRTLRQQCPHFSQWVTKLSGV